MSQCVCPEQEQEPNPAPYNDICVACGKPIKNEHFAWCTFCGKRYTKEEVDKIEGFCPECKSKSVPCFADKDVSIEINWHELHLLCVWAENWQGQSDEIKEPTVSAIARRIQRQYPDLHPLTLSEEVHRIREIEFISDIKTNIKKPPLIPVNGPGAIGFVEKE